jgi:sialic acid synthase SpsE/D-lyxose ketol-isomerase
MKQNIFKNLVVLDLANNHFGNFNHAKKIVKEFGKINKKFKINSTVKFQFRDLPNFVHQDFRESNIKYVRRFLDTKMNMKDFHALFKYIKENSFKTSCTPFDEKSIEVIEKLKFDFLKIASVSALDFNLHERAVKNSIPKIISTGGIDIEDIDKIVSFYMKKKQNFAIMHCVSVYPSKNELLNINFITNLNKRYPQVPIGWSTHETPEQSLPAVLALAKGATIFEKHIGINTKKYKLNNYSIQPKEFESWYTNLINAKTILGKYSKKTHKEEKITIKKLSRGVYAKKEIKKGDVLTPRNTYFAIPLQKGQLSSIELKSNTKSNSNVYKDKPINKSKIKLDSNVIKEYAIRSYIHKAKAMLNYNNINLGEKIDLELSHHKGIENFSKVGCFLFNVVNKEYAKKIIVMLPNQKHPSHSHKKKTETFIVIYGELMLQDGNKKYFLKKDDKIDLMKGSYHNFIAGKDGCVFEEISTTSFSNDSIYKNKKIKNMSRLNRKTFVSNWFNIK